MAPGLRKVVLAAHVVCSVGWLGAVAAFLCLAVAGLGSPREQMVRAAYLAMDSIGWYVIVPLCLASLATGLIQSLGTEWGLFRHYWVLIKLLITLLATVVLLVHMQPIAYMARVAAEAVPSDKDVRDTGFQLVVDAGAALVALLVATVLGVIKPRGLTPYGWARRSR
jgi:hypothetical protein